MAKEKLAIFFNPSAGAGQAGRKRITLERLLRKNGIDYDLFPSQSEQDLRQLIRQKARDYSVAVAAGGDSTLLILINELMQAGSAAKVGFIGLGACNDLARELGIDSLEKACRTLRAANVQRIDLGSVWHDGRLLQCFPGQASLGLGVLVNRALEQAARRPGRSGLTQSLAGISAALRCLHSPQLPLALTVECDEGQASGSWLLGVFGNIRFYASGRLLMPGADMADGLLDGILLAPASVPRLLYLAWLARRGRHTGEKEVRRLRSSSFRIRAERPFLIQVDGELVSDTQGRLEFPEIEFRCLPQALAFCC